MRAIDEGGVTPDGLLEVGDAAQEADVVESADVVSFPRGREGENDAADFGIGHERDDQLLQSLGASTGLEGVRIAWLSARATLATVAFAMADAIAGLAAGGFLGRHLCLAYHGRGRVRRGMWQSG